jgi:hypothetical protein
LSHSTSPIFMKGYLKQGLSELFAQAGFEPWSSRSLPPEKLGLQVWAIVPSFPSLTFNKPHLHSHVLPWILPRDSQRFWKSDHRRHQHP